MNRSDVDRDVERFADVLAGQRVTRQRLRQARDSQPEEELPEMSTTSEAASQEQNIEEDQQSVTSTATNTRQLRVQAERDGELSFTDQDPGVLAEVETPRLNLEGLLGAVGGQLGTPVTQATTATTSTSTRLVSPVLNHQISELISRRNNERGQGLRMQTSPDRGARPRVRANDLQGLGSFHTRSEGRVAVSPARAINTQTTNGRQLMERLERLEQQERLRENQHADTIRDLTRRHEDERRNWERRMQELQRQLQQTGIQMQQTPNPDGQAQAQAPPQYQAYRPLQINTQMGPDQGRIMTPRPPNPQDQQPVLDQQNGEQVMDQVLQQQAMRTPPPNYQQIGGQNHVQMPQVPPYMYYPWFNNFHQNQPAVQQGNWRPPFFMGPGFQPQGDGNRRIDRKDLKLRLFKGTEVYSFKTMVDNLAQALEWSEREKKLQILTHLDDKIRPMFDRMGPDATSDEIMNSLIMRYGCTLTATEVQNRLREISRKSGEDLYSLADRVRQMASRAQMPEMKRKQLERDTFFSALQTNPELQHWVDRYDDVNVPDMSLTLQLAVQWEQQHGTEQKSSRVRRIDDTDSDMPESVTTTTPDSTDAESMISQVSRLDFVRVNDFQTEEGKKLAREHNNMVGVLRRAAKDISSDDRSGNNNSYKKSYNGGSTTSSSSNRNSSDRRRSRSRGRYKKSYRDKSRDKRRRDDKKGDEKKYDKRDRKKRYDRDKKEKVNKTRDSSRSESRSGKSGSDSRSRSRTRSKSKDKSE